MWREQDKAIYLLEYGILEQKVRRFSNEQIQIYQQGCDGDREKKLNTQGYKKHGLGDGRGNSRVVVDGRVMFEQ